MKMVYSTLLKFALDSFGSNEEESIKEKIAQKIMDDSKDLIVTITAINISSLLFITSIIFGSYTLFIKQNFSRVEIFLYLSLIALSISVLIALISYQIIKKRTKVYRDIYNVKENVSGTTLFEPLLRQMKSEQLKMKNNVQRLEVTSNKNSVNIKKENIMNKDILEGNWKQLKGKVQEQWGKLTNDDIDKVEGRYDNLVGRLQKKYGHSKEESERQVNSFLNKH